jgi:hypothetical protein
MKRVPVFAAFLCLWLLACALMPQPTVDVPPPVPWQPSATYTAGAPTATSPASTATSPAPTATPLTPVPTPTLPVLTPTPTREPLEAPGASYVVEQEQAVGEYVIRLWRNTAEQSVGFDKIATISRGDELLARVDQVMEVGPETGHDLTGEGHPEAVMQVYTGGAHCCFSTVAYDLGPTTLTRILEKPPSNCDGAFQDMDGDGIAEYATCDDRLAYAYCPYAGSPMVLVILEYDPARGYVPASPRFSAFYVEVIERHLEQAEYAEPGELGEWDASNKCSILPVVLDFLYSGQDSMAWDTFSRLYTYPDALLFWAEIRQAIAESPLYTPGEAATTVPWPPYYMLQYVASCGTQHQHSLAFLQEGQSPCDPDVPRRDIFWLDTQLRRANILSEEEMVVLAPQGCIDDCHLEVIDMTSNAKPDTLELDTTGGFPGAVYRVNGERGENWRLRGDLTWERIE